MIITVYRKTCQGGLLKLFFCLFSFSGIPEVKSQNVITQHNDLRRTGWNANETQLTQSNVNSLGFGKLFTREVDDQTYSQPLIVNQVPIGGGTHNIVIVTTVNNSVYAYDADDPAATNPYWHVNLTFNPFGTNLYRPVKNSDIIYCEGGYTDFTGNIGIVGTPVIDTNTNTIYVVARSVSKDLPLMFAQYLHALDLLTGADKIAPVYITAKVPGDGDGSDGTNIEFNPLSQNQRPALTLYQGVVYIAWASHCDMDPFHGWVIGYNASDLTQKYVYNATPYGGRGGIWMSGQGIAIDDAGFMYLSTGNGTVGNKTGDPNNTINRGESLIKLSNASGQLVVSDFFTPADYEYLNDQDLDYGSDGVMLIPNTNLSLSGSKESYLYLVDNTNMGKMSANNANVLQMLNINVKDFGSNHIHGTPVYFKDDKGKEFVYCWAEEGFLKQFPFNRAISRFDTLNKIVGHTTLPNGMPGAILAVSSNGLNPGTGILWAAHPIEGDAQGSSVPAIIQAFDASDITHEIWNSNMKGLRDSVGKLAKFVAPTIANGKLYLATFSNKLNVYGLNPRTASNCPNPLPEIWNGADIGYVQVAGDECYNNGVYTLKASGIDIWGIKDGFHSVFQPVPGSNVDVVARVVSLDNTDDSAKAGIMFRSNLDPGSAHVFLSITPGIGPVFQYRKTQNDSSGNSVNHAGLHSPYWIKISNNGNKYVGYVSPDGQAWQALDSITIALGNHPYVGMAYTSHNNQVAGNAVFDNVNVVLHEDSLSVRLLDFTGNNIENEFSQLNWTTGREKNFDHFELQRSGPTTDFQTLVSIPGLGDSEFEQDYSYKDMTPMEGANHYRLKLVDKTGLITYSNTVIVNFTLGVMEIYPNPAKNFIYLKNNTNFTGSQPITVELLDQMGRTILTKSYATEGLGKITVGLPHGLAQTTYFLKVLNYTGAKQSWKIQIKQ